MACVVDIGLGGTPETRCIWQDGPLDVSSIFSEKIILKLGMKYSIL